MIGSLPNVVDASVGDDQLYLDPWPYYVWAQERGGIVWNRALRRVQIFSHHAVRAALADRALVTTFPLRATRRVLGRTIMDADGLSHRAMRAAVVGLFHRDQLAVYRSGIVEPAARVAVARMAQGPVDYLVDVAAWLSTRVITEVLRLPKTDLATLHKQLRPLIDYLDRPGPDTRRAEDARQVLNKLLVGAGLTPAALDALVGTSGADPVGQLLFLLAAGTETTAQSLGLLAVTVAHRPELLEQVAGNPASARPIIKELLRWEPPLHSVIRFAKAQTTIDGTPVARGSTVQLFLAAASNDSVVFRAPRTFLPDREHAQRALTFGAGPHVCLGMDLAMLELETFLKCLAEAFTALEIVGDEPPIVGYTFRGPRSFRLRAVPSKAKGCDTGAAQPGNAG